MMIERKITALARVTCLDCAYTWIAPRQGPKLCPRCRRASRWIACDLEEKPKEERLTPAKGPLSFFHLDNLLMRLHL